MKNSYGKLIVENFGPIKKAEIDLKQLMLFIGPQASGKSTLLKLIAALYYVVGGEKKSNDDSNGLFNIVFNDFYELSDYLNVNTYIEFNAFNCIFKIKGLKPEFVKSSSHIFPIDVYIPVERIFFASYSNVINSLLVNKIPLQTRLVNFGSYFEQARQEMKETEIEIFDIKYKFSDGNDLVSIGNNKYIQLSDSASGYQSTIPMYLIIEKISREFMRKNVPSDKNWFEVGTLRNHAIFIEEPELNLFPSAQKSFAEFLASRLIQYHQKPHSLIISTHSPYIITAFDNLIQAGNAFKKNPKLESKISKIIPKDCWIDFDNVSAYYLEKGKSKSILNKTNRLIAGNKIDEIGEDLAIKFDQLLDLKYSK